MNVETAAGLFVLALLVGVYGSIIGAGGGFLMVSGLVLFFDLGGATAVGTSVITTLFVQAVGAYTYDRSGMVDRQTARWFVIGAIPVSFLSAAWLASRIPQRAFDLIIGFLLIALAVFVVFGPSPGRSDGAVKEPKVMALTGSGALIGVLSGALGVGAGLVTVPLIARLQQLSAHRAAATTTLIGASSGLAAAVGHALAGNPRWSFAPFVIVGAVIGGRIGALSAGKLSAQTVLVLLAGGLVMAGVPLVLRGL